MTDFFIKSTITLSVFLIFYHLILEREKMHQFNRFFLLFSILVSFVVPFVSFEIIKEVPMNLSSKISMDEAGITKIQSEEQIDYTLIFLWSLYGLVTFLMTIRFSSNIWNILSKSNRNPVVDFKNSKLVLIDEKILPHTFLNYIFVNSDDYKNRNIEEELYTHELVHVTQKHTLDILFVEFLKTIFWFNPLFIFYKKAIQLNHEFLADQEIVKEYNNVSFYQKLLLEKGNGNLTIYLASNLNYLVTKKRLIMMTKSTSKNKAFFKKIAVIPVFTTLILLLCVKTVAQESKTEVKAVTSNTETNRAKTAVVLSDEKNATPLNKNQGSMADQNEKVSPRSSVDSIKTSDDIISVDPILKNPEFPGGIMEFYKFIGKNFKIPEEASKNKIQGKIFIEFMVEKDGTLSEFKILKDLGYGIGEEAIKILKLSPAWNPGSEMGKPVRVLYTLPITIQDNETPKKYRVVKGRYQKIDFPPTIFGN